MKCLIVVVTKIYDNVTESTQPGTVPPQPDTGLSDGVDQDTDIKGPRRSVKHPVTLCH